MAIFFDPVYQDVTYLIVKYTCQNSPKLRYYRSGAGHTEEQFLQDVKERMFPEGSTFELYSNYTPCAGRSESNKAPCCDALLDAFNDGTLQAPLDIYAVHVYTNYADPEEKLCRLVQKGFSINALCGKKLEEIISLLPSDHETASREATCSEYFVWRVEKDTSVRLKQISKKATTSA